MEATSLNLFNVAISMKFAHPHFNTKCMYIYSACYLNLATFACIGKGWGSRNICLELFQSLNTYFNYFPYYPLLTSKHILGLFKIHQSLHLLQTCHLLECC